MFPSKEVKLYSPKSPIKVAVLDSGINNSLSIFENSSITSYDAIKNNSTTKDSLGHDTAIAGVIMAPLNKQTVQGISPQVKLFDVKVLNDKGGGEVHSMKQVKSESEEYVFFEPILCKVKHKFKTKHGKLRIPSFESWRV